MILMAIRTILELAAVVLLIVGFINEKKVIAFETALFRAIRLRARNRRREKAREKAAFLARCQSRAPADAPDNGVVFAILRSDKCA